MGSGASSRASVVDEQEHKGPINMESSNGDKVPKKPTEADTASVNSDDDDGGKNEGKASKKSKKTDEELYEEWKPKIDKVVEYLNTSQDYSTEECYNEMEPLFEACKSRRVRKLFGQYCTDDLKLAELFCKVWKGLVTENVYEEKENKWPSKCLKRFKQIYWNFTDTSKELCHAMNEIHATDLVLEELDYPMLAVSELRSDSRRYHLKGSLGILMNTVRLCDECRSSFRKAKAVERVSKYSESTFLIIKAKVLLLLSYIVDEDENDALTATDRSVSFLLDLLRESLKNTTSHVAKTYGLGAEELLQGLVQLTGLENNKVKIGIQGGIYLMCRVLEVAFSEEEQVLAAKVLYNLAFADINKEIIKAYTAASNLLKENENSEVTGLKEACKGILWEVYGKSDMASVKPAVSQNGPHIMISYQWDIQPRMIELRGRLQQFGYRTWMDVDEMEGDLLVAMAEAVENSAVVLVCLSQKYKDSQNCRTEASYAYKQNKPIVPLLVEDEYKADGWLGALVGMLKYYKFVADNEVDSGMPPLMQELGDRGKVGSQHDVGPIVPVKAPSTSSKPIQSSITSASAPKPLSNHDTTDGHSAVKNWTPSEVESWLKSKDLSSVQSKLKSLNGKQLVQMYSQYQRAPDFLLNSLKNDLKVDYFNVLSFTAALEELFL